MPAQRLKFKSGCSDQLFASAPLGVRGSDEPLYNDFRLVLFSYQEMSMKARSRVMLLSIVALLLSTVSLAQTQKAAAKEGVLTAAEVGGKLFPDKVFFRGQVALVQARNSGGVRFADEMLVMAALVDSSGYASGIKEKYQGYLITEVPVDVNGQTLKPGAYGFGFIGDDKFVVMDLGANDVFQVGSKKDADLKHPVPLQLAAGASAGGYRLYKGRDYVEIHRAK